MAEAASVGEAKAIEAAASMEQLNDSDSDEERDENKTENNEHHSRHHHERFTPPDGGLAAWLVVASSFLCNGVLFGTINSFGVIFVALKSAFADDPEAATKASLVGSMAVGFTFLFSPIAGILADRFGIRTTALIGAVLAAIGMALSSFCVQNVTWLYLTYGVMFGIGGSLCYTPSLVILGHYFGRHLGLVNGIVTAGSSIFTIIFPLALSGLIDSYGLETTFRLLAVLTSLLIVATLSFRPLMPKRHHVDPHQHRRSHESSSIIEKLLHIHNWRNRRYVIWALAIPSALFGYFVPYVHIVQYVKETLPGYNGEALVTCIGLTSGIGRIVFGKVADLGIVNRIVLQQLSFVAIGISTMLLVLAPLLPTFQFGALVCIALLMGLFDGCFISLLGPIAYDICGPAGASQAIGFLLGLCSLPLTVGPPVAGLIYDHTGDYTIAFLVAGLPPILGAMLMCCIHRVPVQISLHHREHRGENRNLVGDANDDNKAANNDYRATATNEENV